MLIFGISSRKLYQNKIEFKRSSCWDERSCPYFVLSSFSEQSLQYVNLHNGHCYHDNQVQHGEEVDPEVVGISSVLVPDFTHLEVGLVTQNLCEVGSDVLTDLLWKE